MKVAGKHIAICFYFPRGVRDSSQVITFCVCSPVLREEGPGTLGDVQPLGCQNVLSLDARYVGSV